MWEKWYKMHARVSRARREAVYGLPEINREEIRKARASWPTRAAIRRRCSWDFCRSSKAVVVDLAHLIADAKSGVCGAGRKAEIDTLFAEAADNFKAYGVPGHRHHPEISQGLDADGRTPRRRWSSRRI